MFLKLALENGTEAVEAFKSVDMDNKAVDGDMKKKLDEISKQYGKKEQPREGSTGRVLGKETIQGNSTKATTPTTMTRPGH